HVADHLLDRLQISPHVVPADPGCAIARLQNSAQHPDHGCFAGTVRTKKPEDRSLPDRKRNMINSRESAESLRQPFHFDHWLSHKEQSGTLMPAQTPKEPRTRLRLQFGSIA